MYFVYLLKSKKAKRLYLGYTNDLRKRFAEHNQRLAKATKPYTPWQIVYYEAYLSKGEAIHREHNLKLRANAWNQLKRRIKKSINTDYVWGLTKTINYDRKKNPATNEKINSFNNNYFSNKLFFGSIGFCDWPNDPANYF